MRTYSSRIERVEFLQTHFGAMLVDRVLDVGCDAAHRRSLLNESCYTGIDIQGFIDVKVDLEDGTIPIRGSYSDCVVCLDVP